MSVLDDAQLTLVDSLDEVDNFRRWLGQRRPIMAVDIETSGLSLAKDVVRMVQFGDGAHGWALPWDDWKGVIRYALEEYQGAIVLQHAKFDAGFLTREGLTFPWERTHDTMLMAFIANSMGPKSLKAAAAYYVDPVARAGEKSLKAAMAKNRWTYGSIPIDLPIYWGYAAADTVLTALLAEKLWPQVQYAREAYDLELACERVLCGLEVRGVAMDMDYVRATRAHLAESLDLLLTQLPFNPNAPAEIAAALKGAGIELTKRTDKGAISVDDDVLSKIDHVWAKLTLKARTTSKLLRSYFDTFVEHERDGRVHPHINQLQARTGRMSVTEPALQTLPRTSIVRDAFVPTPGNLMVLADYDNEELRILANISQDPAMIKAFDEGADLHMETARRVYGEGAGKAHRNVGKRAMYAKAYGAQIRKFASTVGLSEEDAGRIFAAISSAYPGIDSAMEKITRVVRERAEAAGSQYGYVVLGDGRRLMVPADKAYAGTNYRIQGQGAVEVKRGIVNLDAAGLGHCIVLPVHDEIVLDIPEEHVEDAQHTIRTAMERHDYRVPLTVGIKVVDRWGSAYRED